MGIPPTSVMMGMPSPIIGTDTTAVTTPQVPVETKLQPTAVPETVLPMQSPTTKKVS